MAYCPAKGKSENLLPQPIPFVKHFLDREKVDLDKWDVPF